MSEHRHEHEHEHEHGKCCHHEHEHEHEHGECCHHEHEHEHEHDECCHHDHEHEHEHERCCEHGACERHEHHEDGCGCGHHHGHSHGDACGCGHEHGGHEEGENRTMLIRLIVGAVLFAGGLTAHFLHAPLYVELPLFLACYAVVAYDVVWNAIRGIVRGNVFGEALLMTIASIGAFVLGEYPEGAAVMLLYQLGEFLTDLALDRSQDSIRAILDIRPDTANVVRNGETLSVSPADVAIGETIVVRPGERIPLDGVILSGTSSLDTRALTGESVPRTALTGDMVLSGCIALDGVLSIRVEKSFGESTASKIIRLVEDAADRKTPTERFITKFARIYTPAVVIAAVLLAVVPSLITGNWLRWLRCGAIFLMIASPSTLAISIPLSCLGGELSAVLSGVLSKGHDCFEVLARVKTMVFGKTGTITEGRFAITGIYTSGPSKEDLLSVAAAAESFSRHPIALLLKGAAGWTPEIAEGVMEVEDIPGRGVSAFIEGRHVYVGNAALLEEHGISYSVPSRAGTAIHVAVENRYWGHILLNDKTRDGAFDALESLRSMGVDQLVMLTGDVLSTSRPLASSLGFDLLRTEMSPEAKVSAIDYLISGKGKGTSVGFVGDGVNDVPMLEAADVGIAIDALHAWSEADAADILLLDDEIELLPAAMRISRSLRRILWENLGGLMGVKLILLLLAIGGSLSIPAAAACTTLTSALALLNSLRAFGLES